MVRGHGVFMGFAGCTMRGLTGLLFRVQHLGRCAREGLGFYC